MPHTPKHKLPASPHTTLFPRPTKSATSQPLFATRLEIIIYIVRFLHPIFGDCDQSTPRWHVKTSTPRPPRVPRQTCFRRTTKRSSTLPSIKFQSQHVSRQTQRTAKFQACNKANVHTFRYPSILLPSRANLGSQNTPLRCSPCSPVASKKNTGDSQYPYHGAADSPLSPSSGDRSSCTKQSNPLASPKIRDWSWSVTLLLSATGHTPPRVCSCTLHSASLKIELNCANGPKTDRAYTISANSCDAKSRRGQNHSRWLAPTPSK